MATQSPHREATAGMSQAASTFLESLSTDQREKATFQYMDGERIFWYYPPLNRHGLALRDMEPRQRELAYEMMAKGLTDRSYEQATQIIDHEEVLGPLEKDAGKISFVRDPLLYYYTVFGEPGGEDPWGWRVEGHHVSLHFSIWGDEVISMTPFFFGANPAEVRKGPKTGLRILGAREDLAIELMEELDDGQRKKAIIFDQAPADILTYNASRASLPREEGLPASRMTGTQREILMALVTEYVSQVRSDVSQQKLAQLRDESLDRLHLAWGGPVTTARVEPHYYRIHGGNFMVEFDNRQDEANHIHSVWRDVENDFAWDVLQRTPAPLPRHLANGPNALCMAHRIWPTGVVEEPMANTKTRVGNVELVSLIDTHGDWDPLETFPSSTREQWSEYPELLDSQGRAHPRYGSVVVRSCGKTILVDTGLAGPDGQLLDDMGRQGIALDSIDLVVITHLHRDHVGWNLTDGRPTFPNARYLFSRTDWEYWTQPSVLAGAEHIVNQVVPLEPLQVMDLIDGDYQITDELTTISTPGHTPGHISIIISSAGRKGFILGDVAHSIAQAHYTDWNPTFDILPELSRKTRHQVLDRLEADGSLVSAGAFPRARLRPVRATGGPTGVAGGIAVSRQPLTPNP